MITLVNSSLSIFTFFPTSEKDYVRLGWRFSKPCACQDNPSTKHQWRYQRWHLHSAYCAHAYVCCVLSEEPIREGATSFHLSACKDSSCCDMIQQFSFVLLEGGVRDVIIDLRRLWHRLPLCSTGCRMSPRDFTQLDPSASPPTNPPTQPPLPTTATK